VVSNSSYEFSFFLRIFVFLEGIKVIVDHGLVKSVRSIRLLSPSSEAEEPMLLCSIFLRQHFMQINALKQIITRNVNELFYYNLHYLLRNVLPKLVNTRNPMYRKAKQS